MPLGLAMACVPARHGAAKLAMLAGMAGAVFVALQAAGEAQDWSGVGQARRRLDAATAQWVQAERRLQAWQAGTAAASAVPTRRARSSGERAAAPGTSVVLAARGGTPTGTDRPSVARTVLPHSLQAPHSPISPISRHDGGRNLPAVVWELAAVAYESGLRLGRLAPAPAEPTGATAHGMPAAEAARRYDLAGTGGFGEVARWLHALARMPAVIAPIRIEVTRRAGGVAVSARVAVYGDAERPAAVPGTVPDSLPAAPAAAFGGSDAITVPRVTGILRDARGSLALLDAAGHARCAAVGERIGAERITRIDANGVWFYTDDGHPQHIALGGEARR